MRKFIIFFISFLIILTIIKNINEKNNIIIKKSKSDNIEYFVRDLENSQDAAEKLSEINNKLQYLINSLDVKEKDGIDRLKKRYNPNTLVETEENSKFTSYSVNKGEKIALCIREKNEPLTFEKDNTIIFVAIHELAHIMTESVGHGPDFWDNMEFLLKKAHQLDIYIPIDYKNNTVEYCGMDITSTPYDF